MILISKGDFKNRQSLSLFHSLRSLDVQFLCSIRKQEKAPKQLKIFYEDLFFCIPTDPRYSFKQCYFLLFKNFLFRNLIAYPMKTQ